MPAKSRSQRRLFGMVHAVQKGKMSAPSKQIADIAKSIKPDAATEFAETKHTGLPNKKRKKKSACLSTNLNFPMRGGLMLKNSELTKLSNLVTNYHLLKLALVQAKAPPVKPPVKQDKQASIRDIIKRSASIPTGEGGAGGAGSAPLAPAIPSAAGGPSVGQGGDVKSLIGSLRKRRTGSLLGPQL